MSRKGIQMHKYANNFRIIQRNIAGLSALKRRKYLGKYLIFIYIGKIVYKVTKNELKNAAMHKNSHKNEFYFKKDLTTGENGCIMGASKKTNGGNTPKESGRNNEKNRFSRACARDAHRRGLHSLLLRSG